MAYVDGGTVIGKYHYGVALLLLDSMDLSARPGEDRNLRGIEPGVAPTSHRVPMPIFPLRLVSTLLAIIGLSHQELLHRNFFPAHGRMEQKRRSTVRGGKK